DLALGRHRLQLLKEPGEIVPFPVKHEHIARQRSALAMAPGAVSGHERRASARLRLAEDAGPDNRRCWWRGRRRLRKRWCDAGRERGDKNGYAHGVTSGRRW